MTTGKLFKMEHNSSRYSIASSACSEVGVPKGSGVAFTWYNLLRTREILARGFSTMSCRSPTKWSGRDPSSGIALWELTNCFSLSGVVPVVLRTPLSTHIWSNFARSTRIWLELTNLRRNTVSVSEYACTKHDPSAYRKQCQQSWDNK